MAPFIFTGILPKPRLTYRPPYASITQKGDDGWSGKYIHIYNPRRDVSFRKKDPVYDPDAQCVITGIGPVRRSISNPNSEFRELQVRLLPGGAPQTGNSYVDDSMANYHAQNWPNREIVLEQGYQIQGRGVIRKDRQGRLYLDADRFNPEAVFDGQGRRIA